MSPINIFIAVCMITLALSHNGKRDSKWYMTDLVESKLLSMLTDDECTSQWPNCANCNEWFVDEDEGLRYVLTNSIPPFEVAPYCPFGVGKGYCLPAGATNCTQFYGLVCPAQPNSPPTGDVEVPQIMLYAFPNAPDPTNDSKPLNLYQMNPLTWWFRDATKTEIIVNHNEDTFSAQKIPFLSKRLFNLKDINFHNKKHAAKPYGAPPPPNPAFQTIGVHEAGIQLKGPAEAEGYNVDAVNIPLKCGGHVTPPIGQGPLYHFHKASTCLMEYNASSTTTHSALIGYANDGFGIYGFYDINGIKPVVDECNGHFGCLDNECKQVTYHYHSYNYTYSGSGQFIPYYTGCLGPAKGLCNTTVHQQYDNGANWCGPGCGGYQICVQTGTNTDTLNAYVNSFGKPNWLKQFTINPY
eukprot:61560_1